MTGFLVIPSSSQLNFIAYARACSNFIQYSVKMYFLECLKNLLFILAKYLVILLGGGAYERLGITLLRGL